MEHVAVELGHPGVILRQQVHLGAVMDLEHGGLAGGVEVCALDRSNLEIDDGDGALQVPRPVHHLLAVAIKAGRAFLHDLDQAVLLGDQDSIQNERPVGLLPEALSSMHHAQRCILFHTARLGPGDSHLGGVIKRHQLALSLQLFPSLAGQGLVLRVLRVMSGHAEHDHCCCWLSYRRWAELRRAGGCRCVSFSMAAATLNLCPAGLRVWGGCDQLCCCACCCCFSCHGHRLCWRDGDLLSDGQVLGTSPIGQWARCACHVGCLQQQQRGVCWAATTEPCRFARSISA